MWTKFNDLQLSKICHSSVTGCLINAEGHFPLEGLKNVLEQLALPPLIDKYVSHYILPVSNCNTFFALVAAIVDENQFSNS